MIFPFDPGALWMMVVTILKPFCNGKRPADEWSKKTDESKKTRRVCAGV
jgi:hypothetical protein